MWSAMTTVAVGLRLSREAWERHSAAAERLGIPFSTYLRQRLDEQDRLADEVAALRAELERRNPEPATGSSGSLPPGVAIEQLLLLRTIAGPQNANIVRKEVERRGLETWR
jgi:hypothetical protein